MHRKVMVPDDNMNGAAVVMVFFAVSGCHINQWALDHPILSPTQYYTKQQQNVLCLWEWDM